MPMRAAAAGGAPSALHRRSRRTATEASENGEDVNEEHHGVEENNGKQAEGEMAEPMGATPATGTPGADTAAEEEGGGGGGGGGRGGSATPAGDTGPRQKFILVSDHGQTALVPIGKAHKYRSLPGREQEEGESGASTPGRKRRLIRVPVKRGRGRPPKKGTKPRFEFVEEYEEEEEEGEGEDTGTPMDEEGSAPPDDEDTPAGGEDEVAGGGAEAELPAPLECNVFVEGKEYVLKNDELQLEDDEAGETKIDRKGNLQGGRKFTFPIFQSAQRPDPEVQYALSIDAAKGSGYRDSFFFYRKNPLLIKLSCTDKEKLWLIEHGRLPAHLRSRNVNMVAVRNVYKLHGAKAIKNGRYVIDDYYEAEARQAGKTEGKPTDAPEEEQPTRTSERRQREVERERERARRRPDAFTYASTDLYGNPWFTTFGDSGEAPFERAKGWPTRRANMQRAELNEDTWMMEMARSVRGMNRELMASRAERLRAFGRPYESIEGAPDEEEEQTKPPQPRAPSEQPQGDISVEDSDQASKAPVATTTTTTAKKRTAASAGLPIGVYEPLTNLPHFPTTTQSRRARFERVHERPILPQANGMHIKRESDGDTPMAAVDGGNNGGRAGGSLTDSKKTGAVLGGSKVGHHAWGVASVEQRVQLPVPRIGHDVRLGAAASLEEMDM